jgi:hypothetical protein
MSVSDTFYKILYLNSAFNIDQGVRLLPIHAKQVQTSLQTIDLNKKTNKQIGLIFDRRQIFRDYFLSCSNKQWSYRMRNVSD